MEEKERLREAAARIVEWYSASRRVLPWRESPTPYHVWISEIMLQQTRIEAVIPYYERFLAELPDVRALAEVGEDRLLKLWEGLGYYSRARNLKKAAIVIMDEYSGTFPQTYAELVKLPGIGEYTAGAIASICFDEKVPAVDGNVLRVIARVQGSKENVLLPQTKKTVTEQLKKIMPQRAGAFNEGLMELGELVCLPNGASLCDSCPLNKQCTAYKKGLTEHLPVRVKKMKRRRADKTVFMIIAADGRIAIEKRPDTGLLSGMYQLPNVEGFHTEEELREILQEWRIEPTDITFTKEAKHVFTHIDWYMKSYRVKVQQTNSHFLWVTEDELKTAYPLPTAFQKLL